MECNPMRSKPSFLLPFCIRFPAKHQSRNVAQAQKLGLLQSKSFVPSVKAVGRRRSATTAGSADDISQENGNQSPHCRPIQERGFGTHGVTHIS